MLLLPLQGVDVEGACQPTEPENKFRSPVSFLFSLCLALVLSLKLSSKKNKKKTKTLQRWPGLHRAVNVPSSSPFLAITAALRGHSSAASYRSLQQHCEAATAPQATGHRSNTVRPQ
jgi:hypothetical protein